MLERVVISQNARGAGPPAATDLDSHPRVSLDVAYVACAHTVLGYEPEGVGSGYKAVSDRRAAGLASLPPDGLQQCIDTGREPEFEQLPDDPIADVPLPGVLIGLARARLVIQHRLNQCCFARVATAAT